ncbi:MAG: hypothetical protein ACRD3E_20480 [Terriglobales bacterium]
MDVTRQSAAEPPEENGPALLNPKQLLPGVDYLYCAECRQHVGAIRLQAGVWEVQCPRCVGECGLCSCKTTQVCRGTGGVDVGTHMYVVERK